MKTASLPAIRVVPEFRQAVQDVLQDGESLSQFVEAAVRAGVEQRRLHAEFLARGLRSRDQARQSGHYVDADAVLQSLQNKLDAARRRTTASGNK